MSTSTPVFVIHFGTNAPFRYHQEVAHILPNANYARIRAILTVITPHTLGKEVVFAFDLSGDEKWCSLQHAVAATYYAMKEERIPLSPAEEDRRRYHLAFATTNQMRRLSED